MHGRNPLVMKDVPYKASKTSNVKGRCIKAIKKKRSQLRWEGWETPAGVFNRRDLVKHMKLQAPTSHTQMPRGRGPPERPDGRPQEAPAKHPVRPRCDARFGLSKLTVPLMFCFSPFCFQPVKLIEVEVVVNQGENRARGKRGRGNQNSPAKTY